MQLVKAYDPAALVAALKEKGVKDAEVVAKDVIDVTCDWLKSSMQLSNEGVFGHLDDLAIPLVDMFQKFADGKLDDLVAKVAAAQAAPADPAPAPAASEPPPST